MLYMPWMVILSDNNMKKTSFENFDFLAAQGEKLQEQLVYPSLGSPPPPPPKTT